MKPSSSEGARGGRLAHSFVSAPTCYRLHRGLGAGLAGIAYVVFPRSHPGNEVPAMERRAAPALALCMVAIVGVGMACFRVAYRLGLEP